MTKGKFLGEFEHVVLLAVHHLEDDGYGMTIRREIEARTGRTVTIGAIYATLNRLQEKGYLSSRTGEATRERGGRARRHYRLEPAGRRALNVARELLDRMWDGADLNVARGRRA